MLTLGNNLLCLKRNYDVRYAAYQVYVYYTQDTKTFWNEKRHYDLTKKERNKKNIWLTDQLHFIWDQLLKNCTLARAPYEFIDACLLFFLFLSFLVKS